MTLYRADNVALSATTGIQAGASYATGAKVAIQLQIPDNQTINIVELGISSDAAPTTSPLVELATTDTASTVTTAHSTTTIKPLLSNVARASQLTMATTGTGYGTGAITSNTTLRTLHKLYAPQVYVYTWPLGMWPVGGNGTAENFVQLRVNTAATQNLYCWLIWDEA